MVPIMPRARKTISPAVGALEIVVAVAIPACLAFFDDLGIEAALRARRKFGAVRLAVTGVDRITWHQNRRGEGWMKVGGIGGPAGAIGPAA
jgi:hypothetical protein